MKNTKNIFAGLLVALAIVSNVNASTVADKKLDEKAQPVVVANKLPMSLPALESPAPQVVKEVKSNTDADVAKKAAAIGLEMKVVSKK